MTKKVQLFLAFVLIALIILSPTVWSLLTADWLEPEPALTPTPTVSPTLTPTPSPTLTPTPTPTPTPTQAGYRIYREADVYYALNFETGNIDYGGTDAGAVINFAFEAGGKKVVLASNTIFVTLTDILPKDGNELQGGGESSLIKAGAGMNTGIINSVGVANVIIRDLAVDGSGYANTRCVYLQNSHDCKVINVHAKHGMLTFAAEGYNIELLGCTAGNSEANGFSFGHSRDCLAQNCISINAEHRNFEVTQSERIQLIDTKGYDAGSECLFFDRSSHCTSMRHESYRAGHDAILIDGSPDGGLGGPAQYNIVEDFLVEDARWNGVHISNDGSYNEVRGKVHNAGQTSHNSFSGVYVSCGDGNCRYNRIKVKYIGDKPVKVRYGFYEDTDPTYVCDYNDYTGCDVVGAQTADYWGIFGKNNIINRLRPLTLTGPKQLKPVANKPISQRVLEDLTEARIEEIAIVLGDVYPEKVKECYGDGRAFNAKISYIYQGEPQGIAHAISLCKEYMNNEPFTVYLGDNLLKGGIKEFAKSFKSSDYDAMILLCEVENPQRSGVAKFNEKGKLIGLVEKPKQPPSSYAPTGIYFLKPTIFKMIEKLKPSWRGELEITEAIQLLLDNG